MTKDEGTMADRVVREGCSETRMMSRSQPCKGLEEEHSRQREVGMSLACLQCKSGGRVTGSEVQGAVNERCGKSRRGV